MWGRVSGQYADHLHSRRPTDLQAIEDESELEAGLMWQKLHRASKIYGLEADTTSFVTLDGSMEVMLVRSLTRQMRLWR